MSLKPARILKTPHGVFKRLIYRIPGMPSLLAWTNPLHLANHLLQRAIKERSHYARGRVLDLGCGSKPYQNLFQHVEQYVGLDLPANRNADVHGNGLALPFQNGIFDTVLCNEVLEHVPEPSLVMEEIARILRPGGYLILTASQTWGLHLEPCDFYRYTRYGLCHMAEKIGLEVVESTQTCGLWATIAQRIADTVIHTYAASQPMWVVRILSTMLVPVLATGFVLDMLFGKRGDTLDNVLVGRKP